MRRDLAQPTPLQVATIALAEMIAAARDTLDTRTYEAFIDIALRRVEREYSRLGLAQLDDWRAAA